STRPTRGKWLSTKSLGRPTSASTRREADVAIALKGCDPLRRLIAIFSDKTTILNRSKRSAGRAPIGQSAHALRPRSVKTLKSFDPERRAGGPKHASRPGDGTGVTQILSPAKTGERAVLARCGSKRLAMTKTSSTFRWISSCDNAPRHAYRVPA